MGVDSESGVSTPNTGGGGGYAGSPAAQAAAATAASSGCHPVLPHQQQHGQQAVQEPQCQKQKQIKGQEGQQQRHYWEDDVFQGHALPDHCRQGLKYHGPQLCCPTLRSLEPTLIAAVHGTDHEGRAFLWLARRHRKRVAQPAHCTSPPPPIDWLGWADVRLWWRNLNWWVAVAFTLGSTLFVVSGVAGEVRSVGDPALQPPGITSRTAALVAWPDVVAANICFFTGGILQILETTHMDYKRCLRAWVAGGRQGRKPYKHRLLPGSYDLRTVTYWAVMIQVTGMLGFNIATATYLASMAKTLQPSLVDWGVNFAFTYGGAAFTASAILFCWEATGSGWRGLVPSRWADLRSISWHAAFWNAYGSAGFLIGGAAGYATSFSWSQLKWLLGVGNLGGAVCFLISSLATLVEQANPQHP